MVDIQLLVDEIIDCNKCNFNKQKVLYFTNENPKIAFVMQNPGSEGKQEKEDIKGKTNSEMVYVWRKYLKKWIRRNNNFFDPFFQRLSEYKLINYKDFETFLTNQIFNEIYITDAIKCRVKTEELRSENFDNCSGFLLQELRAANQLNLIFAFGARTWDWFLKKYAPQIINDNVDIANKKVTNAHGYLFKMNIDNQNYFIIPLLHMSPRIVNNILRNSYFDYLEDGLREYYSQGSV
jgi:uracil-DNA glycosylase